MSFLKKISGFFSQMWRVFTSLKWWQQIITLVLAGLMVIFLFDWIIMPLYTRHGEEHELPDVTEKYLQEATQILERDGFIPIIQDSVFHTYYPAGTVIRQNPISYATVKKGRRVYLVLSSGEKPIYMPDLITETLTNARLRLQQAGIEINEILWDYSDEYPYREIVIKQSVAPDELIRGSQKVNLTLSLGPSPTNEEIPLLIGKSLRRALTELEAIGVLGDKIIIKSRYQPNLVPQTVITQSVGEGTLVGDVDFLELVVSTDRLPDQDDN